MNGDLQERIEALDPELFAAVDSQTTTADCRALLALHSATAQTQGSFEYLEIGSYLGGSLQAMIRDPRCTRIVSIDLRPTAAPDNRAASWTYEDNTTERMRESLSRLPDADLTKLRSFDCDTRELDSRELPGRPDLCFIDGEHTDDAVLRDALFCARAVDGRGVIAFHDPMLVGGGIRDFLRAAWTDVSFAAMLSFPPIDYQGAGVLAVELGDSGTLRRPVIRRAMASGWHNASWTLASKWRRSPRPMFAVWRAVPRIDRLIARARSRL